MEKFIKYTALEAGKILMKSYHNIEKIELKKDAGFVTEADTRSEEYIIDAISREYPDHLILAEESGGRGTKCPYKWIIDPLDGTTNFVNGLPWFCVSIACEFEGHVIIGAVYNPVLNELFFAERNKGAYLNDNEIRISTTAKLSESLLSTGFYYDKGEKLKIAIDKFGIMKECAFSVRRMGSAAIDLAYTAAGRFDGYWEKSLSPWDVAAGVLIVKEAGGSISSFDGKDCTIYDKELVASNGLIHKEMVNILSN
ncbi:MAG: inositol monophosphatase family protein [Candidatus Anammoxibacter sp.]